MESIILLSCMETCANGVQGVLFFLFFVVEGGRINRHIAQKLFTFVQIYLHVCWSIVQIGNVWSHSLPACVQLQSTQPYINPSLTLNSARLSCVFTKLSSIFKPCLYCITVTDLHFGSTTTIFAKPLTVPLPCLPTFSLILPAHCC